MEKTRAHKSATMGKRHAITISDQSIGSRWRLLSSCPLGDGKTYLWIAIANTRCFGTNRAVGLEPWRTQGDKRILNEQPSGQISQIETPNGNLSVHYRVIVSLPGNGNKTVTNLKKGAFFHFNKRSSN